MAFQDYCRILQPFRKEFSLFKRTASVVKQTNEAQPKDLPTQTVDKPFSQGIQKDRCLFDVLYSMTRKVAQKAEQELVGLFYAVLLNAFDFDLDFSIFEKNKNRRSLYIFILYILIFCSFASKKSEVFQGLTDLYDLKKLCI